MPQRLFVLDNQSQDSDFIQMAIWHSKITAWWRPDLTTLKSFILQMHHSTSHVRVPKENSSRLFRSRYFLSCWHFVIPRCLCQCYGNLSRWIHRGFLNMFSRHGMFISCTWSILHCFGIQNMTVVPKWPKIPTHPFWTCISVLPYVHADSVLPYVHADWKDSSIGSTNHSN